MREAGLNPNQLNQRTDDEVVLTRFAEFALQIGRIPVEGELRLKRREDPEFPNSKVFARFGSKSALLEQLERFCKQQERYGAVLSMLPARTSEQHEEAAEPRAKDDEGFVYLAKMGRHYKIGKTYALPRRHRELAVEMPEEIKPIHVIRTDDPSGIEFYWHRRFESKRTNGEWFALTLDDVRVFKKRKFM